MKQYTKLTISYFEEAKLGIELENGTFLYYIAYFKKQNLNDRTFRERVERSINVKLIDGEVVHFNPDGTRRDAQSQGLTQNLQN
ncbi:hypothetical protein CYY_010362 [Polysphondylium violaceum]|uniref:Uncharacterized protein n=1 Tax=Polysphondylium violaceum TaxID=133409 RepID=A0A8J4PK79_9MYCE|nr:hypothetical protein CYY_010362 [Polysphondylium violaceum]